MSDYRDPRDPNPIYSYNDPELRRVRAEAYGSGWTWAMLVGLLLLIGVLIFAYAGSDSSRVAQTETSPPAGKLTPPTKSPTAPPPVTPAPAK